MRKLVLLLSFLSVAVLWSALPAPACGDKLLVLGRGIRFQDAFAAHAASILAYLPSGSRGSAMVSDPQWTSALKKAGHKLQVVGNEDELDRALHAGKYDLVIADVTDAARLDEKVRLAPSGPVLLPMVYEGNKQEVQAAEKQHSCVLKAPGNSGSYLSSIDKAMRLKARRDQSRLRASK